MIAIKDRKAEAIADIIAEKRRQKKLNSILVVGCGAGLEAAVLAQKLGAQVIGIDIKDQFLPEATQFAKLECGDARSLRFDDSSFDFVYSYHALEHIDNPGLALAEMKRVLKDGGGFWIGTPNRNRLLGYIGSKRATLKNKILWNINDWKARLRGTFKNELGAHAGFSSEELGRMLNTVFSTSEEVSDLYYNKIYSSKEALIKCLQYSHLSLIAYPGIYFMGSK